MNKGFLGAVVFGFVLPVWADEPKSQILTLPDVVQTALPEPTVDGANAGDDKGGATLHLQDFAELANYPDVLERLFDQAVASKDMALLAKILPIYQNSPQKDGVLLDYGRALLARHRGDVGASIAILSRLAKDHPEHKPIQFELGISQMLDHRHKSAHATFDKVKADPNLPKGLHQKIHQYQRQSHSTDTTFNLRYLNENNVNNAPKVSNYGNWQLPKAESAQGVGYQLGGSVKAFVDDNVSLDYGVVGFGKYYWDNKAYNDHTTKISLGLGYETARTKVVLTPNANVRHFGNERYSSAVGVDVRHQMSLTPRLQGSHTVQLSKVLHADRPHLDGVDVALSGTWVYGLPSPYHYVYGGYDVMRDDAQDDSDKSVQAGVRFGGQRHFGQVVADGALSVHRRNHQGADFFQIKRQDTLYGLDVSLWRNDWQYKGFVPKLVMGYKKTDSNHFMYKNDGYDVYVVLHKR